MLFRLTIILIIFTSCNRVDKPLLEKRLVNNYFKVDFEPEHEYDSFTYDFFTDSLYLITFTNENEKYAQLGYWNYEKDKFTMSDIGIELKYQIHTFSNEKLVFENSKGKLIATPTTSNELDVKALIGDWTDPTDSIPINIQAPYFSKANLRIGKDSIQVQTSGVTIKKSPYQSVKSSKTIIVESHNNYFLNPILIINSIQEDSLDVTIKDDLGLRHKKTFVRIKNDA